MTDQYAEARAMAGQKGMDVPRILGPAALDMAVTRGALGWAGKPNIANPRTLKDTALAGGAAGAVSGAAAPVANSDSLDNLEYMVQKAIHGMAGAGVGAVAAPLITAGTEAALNLGAKLVGKVKDFVSPSRVVRLTSNAQELEAYLAGQASAAGVSWDKVPENIRESMRQATKRAASVTGQMPDAAIKNRLLAERENLPQLTTGQATRDPVQFSREQNIPAEELRNRLGQQQIAATQRLREHAEGFGPPQTPYEAGDVIATDIAKQAAARKKAIDDLYTAARSTEGKTAAIKNIGEWAQDTQEELQRLSLVNGAKGLRTNHPDIYNTIASLNGRTTGTSRMTVEKAVDTLQGINAIGTQNDPALQLVKTKLQKFLDERAVFHDQDVGTAAIQAFGAARKARAAKGTWEESAAAIKDLASRDPKTAREQIFQKFVVNGKVDDFNAMWETLTPASQQAAQRQFVDRLTSMAMNKAGTDASNYARTLEFLQKFPREKLNTMFPGEQLGRIKNVLEYVRLTREAPPGNFVNRSNTSQALLDFVGSTRNVPILGPSVTGPLSNMRDQVRTSGALSGSLSGPRRGASQKLQNIAEDIGPYIMPPLTNELLGSQQ
jgi:hypothetical protein